jgi:predicted nucleic acid-binding protein
MPFVLDNSVVTGWYLPDQASAYTEAIALQLQTDKALVPSLWQMELANVLKTACTKGKLQMNQARQVLDVLGQLPIEVDTGAAPGQRQLFELAMRYGLSSYDAAYLELAMRHGLPLATRDEQLRLAARAAGVDIVADTL